MKKYSFVVVFALLVTAGLFGGQWTVANAQGTIPPAPPINTGGNEIIPVTGGTATEITVPEKCENVTVGIENVASIVFKDCPKAGTKAGMIVLKADEIPTVEKPLTPLSEVFQITADGNHNAKLSIALSDAEIAKFKQNADYGLYRFDVVNQVWVRVTATLDGNFLVADTEVPGIFAIGIL
jgi:hypothetical protein